MKLERNSNIEALRIVCMLLIIAHHVIDAKTGCKFDSLLVNNVYRCGVLPTVCVPVDCFVLISGWFGIKVNWRKLFSLNNMTTFYAIILGAVYVLAFLKFPDIQSIIKMMLPVVTQQYWFITMYVVLCLLAPFINLLLEYMNEKEVRQLLQLMGVMFVLLPTVGYILNFRSITGDAGYGPVNFVFLYILGRYMRLYHQPKRSAVCYALLFVLTCVSCGIFQLLYSYILGFEFTSLISSDTLFIVAGAVLLFCTFERLNFNNRTINYVSSFALPVYVIHIHPWCFSWFFNDLLGIKKSTDYNFIWYLVIIPFVVYLMCMLVEQMRRSVVSVFNKK